MDIGIDIQDIADFEQAYIRSGESLLEKIFTPQELDNRDTPHLCGLFCAKEAAIKAGITKVGEWLTIYTKVDSSGKPTLYTLDDKKIENASLSISHSKTTCVAVVIRS